jgi:hypothetical protein
MSVIRNRIRPIHPGEILREEFLVPVQMTASGTMRTAAAARPTQADTAFVHEDSSECPATAEPLQTMAFRPRRATSSIRAEESGAAPSKERFSIVLLTLSTFSHTVVGIAPVWRGCRGRLAS